MTTPTTGSNRVVTAPSKQRRIGDSLRAFKQRLSDGDLGSTPVVIGLIIIWVVFQILNPTFLTAPNLVNLALQCAAVGTISIGVVLVLLLGQIDLSVGSISGLAAAILGVTFVQWDWPVVASILLALTAGAAIGAVYGFLYTRFGVPTFIITLAGLLGVLGLQLWVLGDDGSINLPFDSWIVRFAQQMFLPDVVSYIAAVAAAGLYFWVTFRAQRRRAAAGLGSMHITETAIRALSLLALLGFGSWYLNKDRGIGLMFVLFVMLVVCANYMLTRTKWGRSVYAVGGNVEAARRAGIRVNRVYISVFMAATTFAALGGILAAARLAAANQSSGGSDVNLTAIAAAVIGGTSLFGGRGSAWSALLGIVVIMSISSGLTLLSLDSSVRYMVTGAVLLLAVIVDAISRRSRAVHGIA
ncbi:sugar ABC transporter permease [Demequina aurantiaca]|uniref:sugar ABC transporter permease n=1 Tax=Demequina aurantiaca TaxID=676200 RepID=UPI0007857E81|nr:ABC transporter permease [Demequina aurantiaca]